MNNKDRIRLAEAMGWTRLDEGNLWRHPDGSMLPLRCEPPDPFSSADDDYAVLSFYRNMPHCLTKKRFVDELEQFGGMYGYDVGDYARAALKVLDND